MPHDQEDDLEMQMYTTLGKHERQHGKAANEALLKKFGVTRATDVKPKDHEKVIAACSAADGPRQSARANARKLSDFETVVNAAPDLKTGLNMAARAIHARRPK